LLTVFLSWKIYGISKAKSLLCVFAAMVLGTANRAVIFFFGSSLITAIISAVFWALWVVGLWILLILLRKYIPPQDKDKEKK
jgi:hypothetical protein